MKKINILLVLPWLLSAWLPAHAAQAESPARLCSSQSESTLGFAATWEGTVFRGTFGSFDSVIAFDPTDLASSSFDVRIDVTTARTGSRDRDEGMAEPDWFDYKTHPLARYQASDFQNLGGDEYQANGQLELKGAVHPVPVKFTWQVLDGKVLLKGQAGIQRLDFGIGEGDWATDEIIGLLVDVDFNLTLLPCAAP